MSQQDVMLETRSENKTDAMQCWHKHAAIVHLHSFENHRLDFTMSNDDPWAQARTKKNKMYDSTTG